MVRLRAPVLPRVLCVLAVLLAAAAVASSDEAFVLDNGSVLRGRLISDDGDTLVIGLSGPGTDGRLTVARHRVVRRFVAAQAPGAVAGAPASHGTDGLPSPFTAPAPPAAAGPRALPAEEPQAAEEGFFARLARRAAMALPVSPTSRAFVAALGLVVLLCLVGLGARMAEIPCPSLGRSTVLALVLGGLVTAHAVWADPLLRADVASWGVPAALLAWVASAAAVYRCGAARALVLLAFVLFSGALVAFATGVVLVSV